MPAKISAGAKAASALSSGVSSQPSGRVRLASSAAAAAPSKASVSRVPVPGASCNPGLSVCAVAAVMFVVMPNAPKAARKYRRLKIVRAAMFSISIVTSRHWRRCRPSCRSGATPVTFSMLPPPVMLFHSLSSPVSSTPAPKPTPSPRPTLALALAPTFWADAVASPSARPRPRPDRWPRR